MPGERERGEKEKGSEGVALDRNNDSPCAIVRFSLSYFFFTRAHATLFTCRLTLRIYVDETFGGLLWDISPSCVVWREQRGEDVTRTRYLHTFAGNRRAVTSSRYAVYEYWNYGAFSGV